MIEGWRVYAACDGEGPDLWFGEEGETYAKRTARERAAKAICKRCTVQEPCLNLAVNEEITHGIWGGHTPAERRRMRKRSIPHTVVEPAQRAPERVPSATPAEARVLDTRVGWDGIEVILGVSDDPESWHGLSYVVYKGGEIIFRAADEADAWLFYATVTMT